MCSRHTPIIFSRKMTMPWIEARGHDRRREKSARSFRAFRKSAIKPRYRCFRAIGRALLGRKTASVYIESVRPSWLRGVSIRARVIKGGKKKREEKKKRAHRGVEIIAFPCVVNSFLIFPFFPSFSAPLFLFLFFFFLLSIKITPVIELDDLFSHRHFKTTVESLFSIAGFPFF